MQQRTYADLADVRYKVGISIIVPTYREAMNIPYLLDRVDALRRAHDLTLELIFVDDDSRDGSAGILAEAGHDWAHLITRTGERGLGPAVIEGFRAARHPILVCMDGDLSHPPEAIPQLLLGLDAGQQMVVGSRYVPGGSTDDDWGVLRWMVSRGATCLARPLTSLRDPMSGFFALRKADFDAARDLDPVGYKIALELIVKCGFENVGEVPIRFTNRRHGASKLTLGEQLRYIRHLRRLYLHRFANAMHLAEFLVVGLLGLVVNLAVLSVLSLAGAADSLALAGGIAVSVVTNFLLNRRFTFSYARHRPVLLQFWGFVVASAIGMVVTYAVALHLHRQVLEEGPFSLQLAALAGVLCGTGFNFLGSRYVVFRKTYVRR